MAVVFLDGPMCVDELVLEEVGKGTLLSDDVMVAFAVAREEGGSVEMIDVGHVVSSIEPALIKNWPNPPRADVLKFDTPQHSPVGSPQHKSVVYSPVTSGHGYRLLKRWTATANSQQHVLQR